MNHAEARPVDVYFSFSNEIKQAVRTTSVLSWTVDCPFGHRKMVFCNAFGCSNSDKHRKDGVSFHRFPKDVELRKRWVNALRLVSLPENFLQTGRVCSEQFTADDFQRDLQAEMLGGRGRRQLKPGAVPSVFSFTPEPAAKRVRRVAVDRLDRSRVSS